MLVVDDSPQARAAIGEVVVHASGFMLVGTAASGEEALGVLPQLDPELVLLDIRMTGLDGPETARLIQASGSRAAIVLVSALSASELPKEARSCGAAEIIRKADVSPGRLVALWRSLQSNRAVARFDGRDFVHP